MAADGHFGSPSWAIFDDRKSLSIVSDQYATFVFTKLQKATTIIIFFIIWLLVAILDDRKSLSIAFLAISDTLFSQNGCRRPFWMTENHFLSHFSPFQINTQLWYFFHQMAAGGHFGWPKITFNCISRHFRSIRNFDFFWFFFTKWLPAAILDDRKLLSMAFLAISDQCTTFNFFHKMAAGGHFGWPKITFDRITRHFRSIRNFFLNFCFKMAAGGHFGSPIWAILDDRKPLSIAFLAISDHFGSPICAKNNRVLPLCVINGYAKYEVDRWIYDTVRDATSFLSIFIQNGRLRPFCFSDWCQKS